MATSTSTPSVAELAQALIRFDTSNPPGNEGPLLRWLVELLGAAGVESHLIGRDAARPNLVARIAGRGDAPPLLLYGHVDVVPTAGQTWRHDPFGGDLVDGEIWGRGALDMKGGVAIILATVLRLLERADETAGDLILALTSDEESGGAAGAEYLVVECPELFGGVRYAISEIGGYTQHIAGRRFYPIQVSEKTRCGVRATVRGEGGHPATPMRGAAPGRLAQLLRVLDRQRLPVHITPEVRGMLAAMADGLPTLQRAALRPLLIPRLTNPILRALGHDAADLEPLVRNTAVAVQIHGGGGARNVVPSEIVVDIDGRLLPGFTPEQLLEELEEAAPDVAEYEVVSYAPPQRPRADLALFGMLADALRGHDPEGRPFPMVNPGITDARFFARLGIQTYGFLPMRLPPSITTGLIHAADERVPVDALEFGVAALTDALRAYRM